MSLRWETLTTGELLGYSGDLLVATVVIIGEKWEWSIDAVVAPRGFIHRGQWLTAETARTHADVAWTRWCELAGLILKDGAAA